MKIQINYSFVSGQSIFNDVSCCGSSLFCVVLGCPVLEGLEFVVILWLLCRNSGQKSWTKFWNFFSSTWILPGQSGQLTKSQHKNNLYLFNSKNLVEISCFYSTFEKTTVLSTQDTTRTVRTQPGLCWFPKLVLNYAQTAY